MVVGFLTEILLRGLPTRNDRLQEDRLLVFDERHQEHVVLALDDEDALAGVPLGNRMLQDVDQVAAFDVENDVRVWVVVFASYLIAVRRVAMTVPVAGTA